MIDRKALPHIGRVPLRSLTITHLEDLYAHLRRSGSHDGGPLAPEIVVNVHQILRTALSDAERAGLVHPHTDPEKHDSPNPMRARSTRSSERRLITPSPGGSSTATLPVTLAAVDGRPSAVSRDHAPLPSSARSSPPLVGSGSTQRRTSLRTPGYAEARSSDPNGPTSASPTLDCRCHAPCRTSATAPSSSHPRRAPAAEALRSAAPPCTSFDSGDDSSGAMGCRAGPMTGCSATPPAG